MSDTTHRFAISVMFRDHVGIVAEVSAAIEKMGGNLLDVSQLVLRGHFSMILLGDFPVSVSAADIRKSLESIRMLEGACFGVLPVDPADDLPEASVRSIPSSAKSDGLYVLTAAGHDQPGLVAGLSAYLKERGINIVDLSSRRHDGEYTMIWQIQIPENIDVQKLQKSLCLAMNPTLDIGLRHEALFQVTNEI